MSLQRVVASLHLGYETETWLDFHLDSRCDLFFRGPHSAAKSTSGQGCMLNFRCVTIHNFNFVQVAPGCSPWESDLLLIGEWQKQEGFFWRPWAIFLWGPAPWKSDRPLQGGFSLGPPTFHFSGLGRSSASSRDAALSGRLFICEAAVWTIAPKVSFFLGVTHIQLVSNGA